MAKTKEQVKAEMEAEAEAAGLTLQEYYNQQMEAHDMGAREYLNYRKEQE